MSFFESLLVLLLIATILLQLARRLSLPYPTMLAGAGILIALIPGIPGMTLDPETCLALFIAPAVVDAAYDFPPGITRRLWAPLLTYAVLAVILTAGIVAGIAHSVLGLPLAAAIALGAIVAPPDAAAAGAVLHRFSLPRRVDALLKGESLFNDVTALLLLSGALTVLRGGGLTPILGLQILGAAPGGLLLGIAAGYLHRYINLFVRDTLAGNLFQFVNTYLLWIIAERLHLSPVLCVIGLAMTLARASGANNFRARMRVQSFAVWSSVVFTLNVLAFLLMGMQSRSILQRMPPEHLHAALGFAALVVLAVVGARIVVVLGFHLVESRWLASKGNGETIDIGQSFFISWCGMRGFVTIATAFALPDSFPQRDLVVLSAFAVVLATLVLQGITLAPIVRLLKLDRGEEASREFTAAYLALAKAALDGIADREGPEADNLRYRLTLKVQSCLKEDCSASLGQLHAVGLTAVAASRQALEALREDDKIGPETYLDLQEQLDWNELTLLQDSDRKIEEI